MGRIETTQLNGSVQAMQQLAPPAVTIIQPQVDDCSTNGFLQDQTVETTGGIVVNNLIVGRPWTTGLYDCHEHPVNGNLSFLHLILGLVSAMLFYALASLSIIMDLNPCSVLVPSE